MGRGNEKAYDCSRLDCHSNDGEGACYAVCGTACKTFADTCPFFKTKEQQEIEQAQIIQRLFAIERSDLVEKYYSPEQIAESMPV